MILLCESLGVRKRRGVANLNMSKVAEVFKDNRTEWSHTKNARVCRSVLLL